MGRFTNPNYSREFLATLPTGIRKRVNALLGMDKKFVELRKDYETKRNELTRKFELEQATPLYQQRKAIIAGEAAVNDDQVNDGVPEEHKDISVTAPAQPDNKEDNLSGFWLKALQRHVIINDMINEKDAEILKYCIDISCASLEAPANGFTVSFQFAANDFFKNTVLNKTFHLKEIFDELTVDRVEGTKIDWNSNEKNPTIEIVKKKQKAKVKGKVVHRTIEKTQPCESFFRFFAEGPIAGEGGEEQDEDNEDFEDLDEDQKLGLAHVLRDKIVPYAVEYFTGEAPDGSSDLEDDDEFGEEGEEEEEEDEDEGPMMMPAAGRGRGGAPRGKMGGAGGRGGAGGAPGGKMAGGQQECKQQ